MSHGYALGALVALMAWLLRKAISGRPATDGVFDVHGFGIRLYGSKNREALPAHLAIEADHEGWEPHTFQAIRWLTLFYVPIIPLGTVRAMKAKQPFWTVHSARYQLREVPWDWPQVAQQYMVAGSIPVLAWFLFKVLERGAASGW